MLAHSESINEISGALAKAQAEMANASKDNKNPAFGSKYADLASVRDAVGGALSAHGIAYVQAPLTDEHGVSVETRLIHGSGQWVACTVSAKPKDYTPQSIGSAITYLRRYGLMSLCGIAPDDDDGNAASHATAPQAAPRRQAAPQPPRAATTPPAPPQAPAASEPPKWSDAERSRFCAELTTMGFGYDLVADFCESIGRPRPSRMDGTGRSKLLQFLLSTEGKQRFTAFVTGDAAEARS